jgi:hypothetical protein
MNASVGLNWKERLKDLPTPMLLVELERRGISVGDVRDTCPVCRGLGSIDGFWLGTVKTCTSCHGKGWR